MSHVIEPIFDEPGESDREPGLPTDLKVDLMVSQLERSDSRASSASLVELAEHGLVPRRDATGMYQLNYMEALQDAKSETDNAHFASVGDSIRHHILNPDQPHNAHNFLVEMHGYYQGQHAGQVGQRAMRQVAREFNVDDHTVFSDQLRQRTAEELGVLGRYAILRADTRERYIEQEFGELYRREQEHMAVWLPQELEMFGVEAPDIERSRRQIEMTRLAPQDFLIQSVFADRGGYHVFGDYQPGSLQVQAYLGGTMERPAHRDSTMLRKTIRHELGHAASIQPMFIQDVTDRVPEIHPLRVGIMNANGDLVKANEAANELLARLSGGMKIRTDGSDSYDREVGVLFGMAHQKVELFADQIVSCFSSPLAPKFGHAMTEFYRRLRSTKS